jgi:iron complex outermembrane receptor protein
MNKTPINFRGRLMLFTACTVAASLAGASAVMAQQTTITPQPGGTIVNPSQVVIPDNGTAADINAYQIQKVKILYKKLLLKEKDLPAAVTHIGPAAIAAEGENGSVQSLLRNAPSVNEYQSAPGQGVPVVTIRGVRLYELTETLDGNPLSDILSGGQGAFLNNNIGSPVTLDQLSTDPDVPGSTVYPGVAPPDDQGFGSGGGTIAYVTKDPAKTRSAEVFAGYGSFDTSHAGFELNTGSLDGTDTGARAILRYDQGYTNGYDDNTNERYGDMFFKVVKPYDNGLSNIGLDVIYNRGFGYINTAPLPIPLIQQYGYKYNFPKSLTFTSENNAYLTANLHDETYINQYLILSASLFYNRNTSTFLSYQNPNSIAYSPAFPYQITFQVPYFATGAIGPTAQALGVATVGNPTIGGHLQYDPLTFYPGGIAAAEANGDALTTAGYAYGEDAELINNVTNTIGFTPKASIFLPHNTIKLGALIAKENSGGNEFIYGSPNVPQEPGYNETSNGGGSQRSVYQVYAQDQIDLLNNHLHIAPAITVVAAYTSVLSNEGFNYPAAKLQNFDSVAEPYLGISYDLPDHFIAYGSIGKGAYFAPTTDYGLNDINGVLSLTAPRPEIVRLYEAGIRYDTPRLYVNFDGYYQKITDADSFFVNYATGAADDGNFGAEQFKGLETDESVRITPNLSLFGNASVESAKYLTSFFANDTPFEDQFGYVFKGDPLASVPDWLSTFGLDYHIGNFSAHFSEEYTGSQFITYDFQPTLTYAGPNITNNPGCSEGSPIPNQCLGLATVPDSNNQGALKTLIGGAIPEIKQGAFWVSNLLLTYDIPLQHEPIQKLHVELNIQNLFNAHYENHLYSSYAEIPNGTGGYAITSEYNSAFYGEPQAFTLELSAKF